MRRHTVKTRWHGKDAARENEAVRECEATAQGRRGEEKRGGARMQGGAVNVRRRGECEAARANAVKLRGRKGMTLACREEWCFRFKIDILWDIITSCKLGH
jgi:hypothetical protein